MATEFTGRGDPQRSLDLLWGTAKAPTRGPKPGLSVKRIVRAAIDVADADGLATLSMRRVAESLGVGAMSLYTYIPGKAELLDLMMDTVFAEEALPDAGTGGWRARLELHARENWALYQRHPWVLQVSGVRTWLGPNELALFEAALASVAGLGINGREMISVVSLVGGYVKGAARAAAEAAQATQQSGETDNEWWSAREPLLTKYFDPERYPTSVAVYTMGGFDPADGDLEYNMQNAVDDFTFGLQRVLDGVEVFIQRRQAEQPAR
jgi:AcrR family transcriptional regulator